MARPTTPLISRRTCLEAGLRILDEEGLEALSLRRLAKELDVNAASLYHHFSSKEEILAGVANLALKDVRVSDDTSDWKAWVLENVVSFREALRRHPDLVPVLANRHPLRIGVERHEDAVALLERHGVPIERIIPLLVTLEQFALGSVTWVAAAEHSGGLASVDQDLPHLHRAFQAAALDSDELFPVVVRELIEILLTSPLEK